MRPILRNADVLGHGGSLRHTVVGNKAPEIIDYLKYLGKNYFSPTNMNFECTDKVLPLLEHFD